MTTAQPAARPLAAGPSRHRGLVALSFACLWAGGMALTRLLYEWRFPEWASLGRPLPVLAVAVAVALIVTLAGHRLWRTTAGALALTPLLLNIPYLASDRVDLVTGRLLFFGSLWLVAVLLAWALNPRGFRPLGALLLIAALLPVYLLTMSQSVGAADTFEFQVVAPQLGIAHPTGYPLYLLLGKLATLPPVGTPAWRLNLASAVYATAAALVVYWLASGLLRRPLPALLGALALGLAPAYWSQAIVAEVYALHALVVAVALALMLRLVGEEGPRTTDDGRPQTADGRQPAGGRSKTAIALAFVLGLGLTNHLTTVFLIPPALVAFWVGFRRLSVIRRPSSYLALAAAFALPLLLYAYLPLRWQAVNNEPMGLVRFVDWVAGGRFQGALQWMAWLRDPARWSIVARLYLDAWGWFYLALAGVGLAYLFLRRRWAAVILLLTAAGFTFYALNYYVPDLSVFLIPAHIVVAVWVASGVAALTEPVMRLETRFLPRNRVSKSGGTAAGLVFLLCAAPLLLRAPEVFAALDQSARDGGETWGRGVLALPLDEGAAVLADSEKIAPLYYLQQAEGLRPDLDIMVLPDEAAYRAELDARVAAGQTVYLARYLPGLAGAYHLRSAGPLVEVSPRPVASLPATAGPADLIAGPLHLLGYEVEPSAVVDPNAAALTLYWKRPGEAGSPPPVVYLRWASQRRETPPLVATGRHPAGDAYPINAWREGEIVPDFHLLPYPAGLCPGHDACELMVQVAVAPRFTAAREMDWQTVTTVKVPPISGPTGRAQRALFDGFALDGVDVAAQARAGATVPVRYSGPGHSVGLEWLLVPPYALTSILYGMDEAPATSPDGESLVRSAQAGPATTEEPYALVALAPVDESVVCGWLQQPSNGCVVADVEVSGAALPETATNFDDKMALLDIDLPDDVLTPGGTFRVDLDWLALADMSEDYTVTVQVLDAADRIVGQVDAWPVQGTFPTSQWRPGQVIADPYVVQLAPDLVEGEYRVLVGVYLLETLERLPVVDESGAPAADSALVVVTQ